MTLFIIIAIFIAFVIAIVATDKNQGNYEDRQKILARKLFGSKESEPDVDQMIDNLRILKIAGINYRDGISRYVGRVNCALVPEPDNEYDPDAIKIVAEDRHHLGYIQSGQTDLVCSLTANEFPYRCTAIIEEHEDEDDGHRFYTGYVYIKRLD